jgi:LPXTG-site transpeptidase (sortase) family protein
MSSLKAWKRLNKGVLIVGVAVLALTIIGFVIWSQGSKITPQPPATSPEAKQQAEGRDERPVPENLLSSYKVADYLPRILSIEKLSISARILPMGINPDGSMQAPGNINDSGWYQGSARPGAPGAMVIDGHVGGPTKPGIFARLDTLVAGDFIKLEKGNHEVLTYQVVQVKTVPLESVNMAEVLKPFDKQTEGLNLITCTGAWLKDQKTYDKRVLIFAKRVITT